MEKTVFGDYIFNDNLSGGLSLANFSKEDQTGGGKVKYDNRFKDLVIPAGLVSCYQKKPRYVEEKLLESKLINESLFDMFVEKVQTNNKNNKTKKNKNIFNKTMKALQ